MPRNSPLCPSLAVGDLVTAVSDSPLSHGLFSLESVPSRAQGTSEAPAFFISKRLVRQKDAFCCRGSQWRTFHASQTKRCFATAARAVCLDAMNAASQPLCHSHEDCAAGTGCARPKRCGDGRLIVMCVAQKKLGAVRVLFDGSVAEIASSSFLMLPL
ncbi:hypothetical protein FGB62_6g01 [Gracilaria domingensis]|nr:hypothetical protein FGB62_6g01 [Gracilaria domingensis]